jgi:hypothetical protein
MSTAPGHNAKYGWAPAPVITVYVERVPFALSQFQVSAEPGNLLQHIIEAKFNTPGRERIHEHDGRALCFALIVDHLSGQEIFPISKAMAEMVGLSRDQIIRYLKKDADQLMMPILLNLAKEEHARIEAENAARPPETELITMEKLRLRYETDLEIHRLKHKAQQERLRFDQKLKMKQDEHAFQLHKLHYELEFARWEASLVSEEMQRLLRDLSSKSKKNVFPRKKRPPYSEV